MVEVHIWDQPSIEKINIIQQPLIFGHDCVFRVLDLGDQDHLVLGLPILEQHWNLDGSVPAARESCQNRDEFHITIYPPHGLLHRVPGPCVCMKIEK